MTNTIISQTAPILVAIDISMTRHEVLIDVPEKKRRRRLTVLNQLDDFKRLITTLSEYARPVRVAFEATGNYHRALAYQLATAGCDVKLVSLMALARTREALHNSWDKNDPKDAQVILHMMPCSFIIMVIGSLSSTADSDLAALSSIVITDIYGSKFTDKSKANAKHMLFIGRITMIVATALALYLATKQFNILELLVLVGAIWGALVFPVIASFYWDKVTNKAFGIAVVSALVVFFPVRFGLISLSGPLAIISDILAIIGIGVVAGLMAFGFFGKRAALIIGSLAALICAPYAYVSISNYTILTASLLAYAVSTIICTLLSWNSKTNFDFTTIAQKTGHFDICPDTQKMEGV